MTKLIISTRPDDTHAVCVKLALEKNGHQADLWYTADYPSQLTYSFHVKQDALDWQARGHDCDIQKDNYDAIWYRRPAKPVLPDFLHADDVKNARQENLALTHNMWQVIFPNGRWINPVKGAENARSKLLQLKIATELRLKVPDTIISNDPRMIHAYIKKQHRKTIYKSLHPMTWLNKKELRLAYTSLVSTEDLPSNKLLQCTPGIFQEKIDKQYELRITYFGDKYIAVKIDSQAHEQAQLDWRAAATHELSLEQVMLPEAIDLACRSLMEKLGIVFGCFDFIVTHDNEYYFLEVNEQGQFLWIEEVNPEIKMLQTFCNFISNEDYDNIALKKFAKDALKVKQEAMRNHVNPA